jgi:hypothetical protein
MKMPGFSAEASLFKSTKHYTVVAIGTASSNQIVPQQTGLCNKAAYYCNRGYENWCRILERYCLNS